ncbi:tol-pal system protein YbgF [Sneathiella marina]|uniref:Cell division coordinator CpoB n=1 Tax=Sneathiella marina TaxID=2950108 RepID=A0ABY4W6P2_9PROT|nr:tol-pal system protein YbgF [Sneathiella marina]USG62703.1 tol-pal system protein YbgF [Sneathiella marina]
MTKNILFGTGIRILRVCQPVKTVSRCLVAVSILFATTTLSFAQSSEVQALIDRINRLELDLNDVQRQLYNGTPPPPRPQAAPSTSAPSTLGTTGNTSGLALLTGRISAIEDEQRRLTGAQEETLFKIDQVKNRLDKLVKDVDFRLTAIERQLGGGAGTAVLVPPQGQTGNTAATSNTVVIDSGSVPEGSKVLGTVAAPTTAGGGTANNTAASTAAAGVATAAVVGNLPAGSPSEQYNYAISLVRAGEYDQAEAAFSEFLQQHKDHDLAGNAQYWLGETFYVRGDYPNAASAFFEGYETYPDNSKAADNLLKLAMTLGRMDQKEEACATFAQIDKQFNTLPARLVRSINREKQKLECSG